MALRDDLMVVIPQTVIDEGYFRTEEIVHEGARDARAAEAPGSGVVTEADTVGRWGR